MAVSQQLPSPKERRTIHHLDFWSDLQATVTLTAAAQDLALPDVVVEDLPDGATIHRVVALFKYRAVENTNASANQIDDNGGGNTPAIQVRDDTPGTYVDAINVVDATCVVAASTVGGGDVWVGDNDINATVDGEDTYNFLWDDAEADGANLVFRDVQTGLRVYFTL